MPQIKVIKPVESVRQISAQEVANQMDSEYVTKSDLSELTSMFGQLQKQINPESALSPEVRSVVKAVEDVQGLKNALKDPTSLGIEQATSNLVTTVLGNALGSMSGAGQGVQAPPKSLLNTVVEIATHNITSNLPQILESAKSVLGPERLQQGYDMGLKYVENKQSDNDFINTVMTLDENNDEHINYYAQQMGYTNFDKARNALIEHKIVLYQEQQEYQDIQKGQTQRTNDNVIVEEQIVEEQPHESPVIELHPMSEPVVGQIEKQIIDEQIVENVVVEKVTVEDDNNIIIEDNVVSDEPLKIQINKKKFFNPLKIKVLNENKVDDDLDSIVNEIYDDLTV